MKISEIAKDSSVSIQIEVQGQQLSLSTKAILGMQDSLFVERIKIGEGDLIWKKLCIATIQNKSDNNTYIFHAMSIEPVETQFGFAHKISSAFDGKQKRQRKSQRMEVICMGSCFCRGTTYKAIVYDISLTGIAVILDGNVNMRIGDTCTIYFSIGGKTEVLHSFEVSAKVVRFFDEKGRVAIGCTIEEMPEKLLDELTRRKNEKEKHKAALEKVKVKEQENKKN